MNEIEKYLDDVCRTLGGSHDLRQHVREELREHLEEAVEAHVAKGLPRDEAVKKAIDEFGRPEDVGKGLEGVYGHRMMALAIDKAMDWKERTMKSGWKWSFVATAGLFFVIATQVAFIMCMSTFVLPRIEFWYTWYNLGSDPHVLSLSALHAARLLGADSWVAWTLVGLFVAAWALFEWRSKSENKTLVRLGVGAFVAVVLMPAVWFATVVALANAGPPTVRGDMQPIFASRFRDADTAMADLKRAIAAENWRTAGDRMHDIVLALQPLRQWREAAPILVAMKMPGETQKVQGLLDEVTRRQDDLFRSLFEHVDPATSAPDARFAAERAPADFDRLGKAWEALTREVQCESTDAVVAPVALKAQVPEKSYE